jgi:ATP-dependent Lhr-like helicase
LRTALEDIEQRPIHLIETENLTPMAFPLWADRLSATLPAGDAASRLEQMLQDLNRAASK